MRAAVRASSARRHYLVSVETAIRSVPPHPDPLPPAERYVFTTIAGAKSGDWVCATGKVSLARAHFRHLLHVRAATDAGLPIVRAASGRRPSTGTLNALAGKEGGTKVRLVYRCCVFTGGLEAVGGGGSWSVPPAVCDRLAAYLRSSS